MAGEVEGGHARSDPEAPARALRPASSARAARSGRPSRGWYWLLLLPFLALLYPPLYSHLTPRIFGIPFFYWYQAVWLAITAAITTIVYRRTR